jgi:hypothetical protein
MSEMILPGVYIEVRPEGLISAGQITVGNIGIVGTARKGTPNEAKLLNSYANAVEWFGGYDAYDPTAPSPPLTLVRALQLAYNNGATSVYAVRVAAGTPGTATFTVAGAGGTAVRLQARSPGSWGNDIEINVTGADTDAVIASEDITAAATIQLGRLKVKPNDSRNRIRIFTPAGGTKVLTVAYGAAAGAAGTAVIDDTSGQVHFAAADVADPDARVLASYVVPQLESRRVTLREGANTEVYTVADGRHLETLLKAANSSLAVAAAGTATGEIPTAFASATEFRAFGAGTGNTPGSDGAGAGQTEYEAGLARLLNEDAHIIVAAGMDAGTIADELLAHVQNASTDKVRRDRIAVVGSAAATPGSLSELTQRGVSSDRVIFVAPGIKVADAASRTDVKLPGAYAAAAVAGMLSARAPHISLTNKPVAAGGAEVKLNPAELEQLVQERVLALEERRGGEVRVVKGITTDDGAFKQITTRRIVDYAKFGVRSAAQPFIGLLNNDRVRKAMKGSINGFLAGMVDDEMLVGYELDVTATREEEIRGIARVTMTVKPTFSIDYIKVTMFLG